MITATPVHVKSNGFGPLVYRTKDKVLHYYQYYGIMPNMGDEHHHLHFVEEGCMKGDWCLEHHHLHFVEEGCMKGDWCLWNIQHEYQLSKAENDDALLHYKIVATTDEELHKEHNIPLIPESFIPLFTHQLAHGDAQPVELVTETKCKTGRHCRYGSIMTSRHKCKSGCIHTVEKLKLNSEGEVIIHKEVPVMVDWNKLSLEQLIAHLEDEFMFSSTGTAKAVHELIRAYKGKEKSDEELMRIFDQNAKKSMTQWSLDSFKQSHPKLLRAIINSMKDGRNEKGI